jgi:NAD(P)-dependent dehydrogenase (short-subunit alcohol dehydrogenase family)
MSRLTGRIAVVTGTAQGIGAAIARRLSLEGAIVYALDRVPSAIPAGDDRAIRHRVLDLTDLQGIRDVFGELATSHGRCDIVVNNAGIPGEGALQDLTVEAWNRVFAVNVTAPMLVCQAAAPLLGPGGSIVNLASVAAHIGFAERAAYCASKAAVLGLTRALAVELAPAGVRVNCLCPGTVQTPWIDRLVGDGEEAPARLSRMQGRQLLGRLGAPDEIAAAVAFLASDDASFITGSILTADGGMLAAL